MWQTIRCAGIIALLSMACSALAQIPAFLPNKKDVTPTEALPIDGLWLVTPLNKRIRVDRGRAYAVDSWTHAFVLSIQPDMVTVKNIKQTGDNTYVGDDLPALGPVTWTVQSDGTISAAVGLFGYKLIPQESNVAMFKTAAASTNRNGTQQNSIQTSSNQPTLTSPSQGKAVPITAGSVSNVPDFVTYDAFTGCQPDEASVPAVDSPRDRMEDAVRVDKITQRRFAAFSLDEVESGVEDERMKGLCWKRLDGVWREMGDITLDRSKDNAQIWGSSSPELISLANGNYTSPTYLFIGSTGKDNEELWITESTSRTGYIRFTSTDGVVLDDVLKRGGPRKTYQASRQTALGSKLSVDVSRSGRVRLRLGTATYLRPQPGVSQATMSSQLAANDAFLLSYNLENLSASRKGYDVITQDAFFLLENPKYDVFAKVDPSAYFISEKRTVPLGLTLVQEATQGMVFNKSMVTSASQMQTTVSVTFGSSAKVGNDNVGSTSAGYQASLSASRSMEKSKSVAQAIGYSRSKQYALVVDHPFVTLSDDLLDAVEDARRYGDYDAILQNFGTHYPYAVTYGAAAKVTQSVSEEQYKTIVHVEGGFSADFAAKSAAGGGSSNFGVEASNTSGNSGSIGEEGATFVAVGGNGSWNENGYSAGQTPYPILLDLRPLYDLLNPMNFPEEPEIYIGVRDELERRTIAYIKEYENKLSTTSLLPDVQPLTPEPIEVWYLYVRSVTCTGKGVSRVKDFSGKLEMEAYQGSKGNGYLTTDKKTLSSKCKRKKEDARKTYDYNSKSAGLIEVRGTRSQIANYSLRLELDWSYNNHAYDGKKRSNEKIMKPTKALKNGLKPKTSATYNWTIGAKSLPDITLAVRMKRIK